MQISRVKSQESGIFGAHMEGKPEIASFLTPLRDRGAWEQLKDHIYKAPHAERLGLVEALREYNLRIGTSAKGLSSLDRLLDPAALVIITGQQAGLLGGPLYTQYKALGVIQLAAQLEEEYGVPVVPLFWVASEDHDFAEVNQWHYIDNQRNMHTLQLDKQPERTPIGFLPIDETVFDFLSELNRVPGQFKEIWQELFQKEAQATYDMATWFARIMARLFADTTLAFVDPMVPELKALATEHILNVVENTDQIQAKLLETTSELEKRGFSGQVHALPDHLPYFYFTISGQRHAITREGDRIKVGNDLEFSWTDFKQEILDHPERFSPNVIARPLLQDFLFPTLAYVAGPGETAYFAQYKHIYQVLGVPMPIIYPRPRLTLVPPEIARQMENYGWTVAGLQKEGEHLLKSTLARLDPQGRIQQFTAYESLLKQSFAEMQQSWPAKLQNYTLKTERHMLRDLVWLRRKLEKYERDQIEGLEPAFRRFWLHLYPNGQPQERVLSLAVYLFLYGEALWTDLQKQQLVDRTDFRPYCISLGG